MSKTSTIKVVFLGESNVGKTNIIFKFVNDIYSPNFMASTSAQFASKTIYFPDLGQLIKFEILDHPGNERFRSLAKIYYKEAKAVIFIYDITAKSSLEKLKAFWYEEVKNNSNNNPILAVVANNIHAYQYQQVSNNDGKEFADKIGAIFQATSASSGFGISTLFDNIGKAYLIPGYDYRLGKIESQEDYMKQIQEANSKQKRRKNNEKIKLNNQKGSSKEKCY